MPEKPGGELLEREDVGAVTVARVKVPMLRGDDTTESVFDQLYALVEEAGRPRLVLDLDGVEYLASVAVGKLVMLMRKARSAHGRLALCKLTPAVDELLQLTHLVEIVPVYADEREAVRSFA